MAAPPASVCTLSSCLSRGVAGPFCRGSKRAAMQHCVSHRQARSRRRAAHKRAAHARLHHVGEHHGTAVGAARDGLLGHHDARCAAQHALLPLRAAAPAPRPAAGDARLGCVRAGARADRRSVVQPKAAPSLGPGTARLDQQTVLHQPARNKERSSQANYASCRRGKQRTPMRRRYKCDGHNIRRISPPSWAPPGLAAPPAPPTPRRCTPAAVAR
jgi:hypothetical protein